MFSKKSFIAIIFILFFVQFLFAQKDPQHPPVANNDFDTAEINTTLTVDAPGVLKNDTDEDGDKLSVTTFSVNGTSYNAGQTATFTQGSITIKADGSFTFIPTTGYTGNDVPMIEYTISDKKEFATAALFLTVEHITNLLEIKNFASCNQGYTVADEYKINYSFELTNKSTARDYHANNLIKNINLTDNLNAAFGSGCIKGIEVVNISTIQAEDYIGKPYPLDFDSSSINTAFESGTSGVVFNKNTIKNGVLYPRQSIRILLCVTVNPYCNGRPNPTPSGSGIDFDNVINVTSTKGSDTKNLKLTDFHTQKAVVASSLYVPVPEPKINLDGTYDYTNTVIITNEGTEIAKNVNFNMGLQSFLDTGITFKELKIKQISGSTVTINNAYDGNTKTQLLMPGNSLAPKKTIVLEIFSLTNPISTAKGGFYQPTQSQTQGVADGFDDTNVVNKKYVSYVLWDDSLGKHLDRYNVAASKSDIPTSVSQCNCTGAGMNFSFSSASLNEKEITVVNKAPNGILEHQEVTFQLKATNKSERVQLKKLQLTDNLNSVCGGNIIRITKMPFIKESTATTKPVLNTAFNGTTDVNIFDGVSGFLEPDQYVIVEFTVVFDEDCIGANTSEFSGEDPLMNTVSSSGNVTVNATTDTDNDGISNANDIDDDNDTIPDTEEYGGINPTADDDSDFIPNYRDIDFGVDKNSDGIVDIFDFDNDGVPNHLDLDSDNDGILDIVEVGNINLDTNKNGQTNGSVGNNGLDDTIENDDSNSTTITFVIPNTDGNGKPNYLDIDADADGIVDNIEGQATDKYIAPKGAVTNFGIDTAYPQGIIPIDTEKDTIPDYIDTNSDKDVRGDVIEGWDINSDGIPETSPANSDNDNDGLDDAFDRNDNLLDSTNGQTPNDFPNADNKETPEKDWRENISIVVKIKNVSKKEGTDFIFDISLVTMNDVPINIATPVIIDFSTTDGSDGATKYQIATTPFDYTPVSEGTAIVTIPPGASTSQITVTSLDDTIYEKTESFTLNGKITSNNTTSTTTKATGYIIDNDSPPTITMTDATAKEGNDLQHTITISNPSSTPIDIKLTTNDGTAKATKEGGDYKVTVKKITIPGTIDPSKPNTSTVFIVPTRTDNTNEADEETVKITGRVITGNVGTQDLNKTGTIIDIDPKPTIEIKDVTVVEGNPLQFTIRLLNASSEPMFNYLPIKYIVKTINGTAYGSNDFAPLSKTLVIPALTSSIKQPVITFDDILNEETETMTLQAIFNSGIIANPSNIIEAIGTIKDNDIPNLFSPNGDNKSDVFKISGIEGFPNFKLQIYDRWGSKVYEYSNNGRTEPIWWDGKRNGNPVPEGVYYYTLDFNDGITKSKTNFIELIR